MASANQPSFAPRVLVVMDDPLASVLALLLRHGRYEGRVTTERGEFLRLLPEWRPHAVLVDLDLHPEFLALTQSSPTVRVPTLVMDGGDSPAFMHNGAQALVDALPNGQYRRLPGQTHDIVPEVMAPVLEEFFA